MRGLIVRPSQSGAPSVSTFRSPETSRILETSPRRVETGTSPGSDFTVLETSRVTGSSERGTESSDFTLRSVTRASETGIVSSPTTADRSSIRLRIHELHGLARSIGEATPVVAPRTPLQRLGNRNPSPAIFIAAEQEESATLTAKGVRGDTLEKLLATDNPVDAPSVTIPG